MSAIEQATRNDRSVVLATNELLAFADGTGLAAIHGVDADFDELRAAPGATRRVELGLESLIRRGLAQVNVAGEIEFGLMLRALVGGAAMADGVITLTRVNAGTAESVVHILRTPEITLTCQQRDRDIWAFTALIPPEAALALAGEFLLGMTPIDQPRDVVARLSVSAFATLLSELQEEEATGPHSVLVAAGIPTEAADDLLDDMRNRSSWTCVVVSNVRAGFSMAMEAVTVVNAATHCWLTRAIEAGGSAAVEIRAATVAECRAAVLSLIEAHVSRASAVNTTPAGTGK